MFKNDIQANKQHIDMNIEKCNQEKEANDITNEVIFHNMII